jgi:hypothetical protein
MDSYLRLGVLFFLSMARPECPSEWGVEGRRRYRSVVTGSLGRCTMKRTRPCCQKGEACVRSISSGGRWARLGCAIILHAASCDTFGSWKASSWRSINPPTNRPSTQSSASRVQGALYFILAWKTPRCIAFIISKTDAFFFQAHRISNDWLPHPLPLETLQNYMNNPPTITSSPAPDFLSQLPLPSPLCDSYLVQPLGSNFLLLHLIFGRPFHPVPSPFFPFVSGSGFNVSFDLCWLSFHPPLLPQLGEGV